jgi:crotonobetainyl-CoA:carnitine CoA-transferase CaiB-like acyl-CoA transferase
MFQDPQVLARGLAVNIRTRWRGVPQVASPIRLSETPVEYRQAPPLLGEHTEAVLRDVLGLDAMAVHELRTAGVL